ncbi:hypothetical protein BC941DRAFT_428889 [Chlamydoabsidia padenii]|nr:hypothetical protein BC941DRAFT_428889 [Chlamydoabsidia padenii]
MSLTDLSQKFTQWSSRIEQNKEELETELNRWKGYKEEYEALGKQLETLADETSRPAMIPFGSLAFMPGKLIHTNEIMVYLGDQYYVERSTKQALGILNRRKEAVDENLNLVQAQWNAIKAKSDSVNNNVFPSGEGVNEEGLPIMEIREELPPDSVDEVATINSTPTDNASSSAAVTTALSPTTVKDTLNDTNTDYDQKDLMAILDALEQEEEEEERMKQQQTFEQQLSFYDPEETTEQINYDDEDLDDLYDTEVADNIFDHFEDDEEYATQGVVDQEDWSTREDLDNGDTDGQLEIDMGSKSSLDEPLRDVVAERQSDTHIPSPSTESSLATLKQTIGLSELATTPPAEKKVSRFKKLHLEKQQSDTIDSTITDDEPKKKLLSTKPKFKVIKPSERKRQPEQQQQQQQQKSPPVSSPDSIPKVIASKTNDSTPPPVSSTVSEKREQQQSPTTSPPPDQPKKKMSKFKQFQEQQRQNQPSIKHHDEPAKKLTSKGTPIQVPNRNAPIKQATTITSTDITTSGKKKVSWGTTTSVREHDRTSAPTTDPRDSYDKPLKAAHNTGSMQQHTIRSPSDIFRVVKQHQPTAMDEDGYPVLGNDDDTTKIDLRELATSVSLSTPEPMFRPNYEVDEDKLPTTQPWRPTTQTLVQSKSKMDTTTMRGAVFEREAEELNLDEVEDDMDFKEIKSSYQRQRQGMLATMGGLSFDSKPEFEVIDEDLPLPSSNIKDEEAPEVPRKISRFKAARMGLASTTEQ